jgi:hypothetical protein
VKMIPIVVVVSEADLHQIDLIVDESPDPPEQLRELFARNGWTKHSICVGQMIGAYLNELSVA